MIENFLWGGSTSAFQFEGGGHEGGKGKSIYDVREEKTGIKYSEASDFYHHYETDIQLLEEMGFNSFRMSIAWTRLFPNGIEDKPNQEGIDFYNKIFKRLKLAGIEPVVTLFHWDMPQYLVDCYDGFKSRETVTFFEKYCEVCFKEFGRDVKYWLTLNENNLSMLFPNMYLKNKLSTEHKEYNQTCWDCYYHSILAHFKAVKLCHEIIPDAKIGNMLASAYAYPLSPNPKDVFEAIQHNKKTMWNDLDILTSGKINEVYLNQLYEKNIHVNITGEDRVVMQDAKAKIDFISFSYYFSLCVQDEVNKKNTEAETMQMLYQGYYNPYLSRTSFGWQIDSVGLRSFVNEVHDRYHLPLMVVENGCGVEGEILTEKNEIHDEYRIDYLRQHISELLKAKNIDKIPIIGYLPWGVIDLYSASGNRNKRYGFVFVDFDNNLERYKKDSFYWYKEVIESDGEIL